MSIRATVLTAVVLAACSPPLPEPIPSPGGWDVPAPATQFDLIEGTGTGSASVWVRGVGMHGGSVTAPAVTVVADGVSRTVTLDPFGYGRVDFDTPGEHTVELDGALAIARVFPEPFPTFGLRHGVATGLFPDNDLAAAQQGVLALIDGTLWYSAPDGRTHPVLEPDEPVLGVVEGALEGDGVLDAVAWSSGRVYLLRGRADGGLGLIRTLESSTHTVASAVLADADDDGAVDVICAWEGVQGVDEAATAGILDIWLGDGTLGFTASANRALLHRPLSVTAGKTVPDGPTEITVYHDEAGWDRFYGVEGGRFNTAGPALDLTLPSLGKLVNLHDLFADGGDELMVVGPREDGEDRRFFVLDLQGPPRSNTFDRQGAWFARLPLSARDGLIFSSPEGDLVFLHQSGAVERLAVDDLVPDGTTGGGPIGVAGSGEVVVADPDHWGWFDRTDDDDSPLVRPTFESLDLVVRDGLFALHTPPDGPPRVVYLRPNDNSTVLRSAVLSSTGPTVVVDQILSVDNPELRDLEVCGDHAWILLEDQLLRVDLASDPPTSDTVPVTDGATVLACGAGPDGAVVAIGGPSGTHTYNDALTLLATDPAPVSALALDREGVHGCNTQDCQVASLSASEGLPPTRVTTEASGGTLDEQPVVGGPITLGDVDGDGVEDLIVQAPSALQVHRHLAGRWMPAELAITGRVLSGRVRLADVDGNGLPEVLVAHPETQRLHLSPHGPLPPAPPGAP